MVLEKLENLNPQQIGPAGVVRELRTTPEFFETYFKAKNSPKYFNRLLNHAGELVDTGTNDLVLALYLLVLSELDVIVATSISRAIINDSNSEWLRSLAYSYLLKRELDND